MKCRLSPGNSIGGADLKPADLCNVSWQDPENGRILRSAIITQRGRIEFAAWFNDPFQEPLFIHRQGRTTIASVEQLKLALERASHQHNQLSRTCGGYAEDHTSGADGNQAVHCWNNKASLLMHPLASWANDFSGNTQIASEYRIAYESLWKEVMDLIPWHGSSADLIR